LTGIFVIAANAIAGILSSSVQMMTTIGYPKKICFRKVVDVKKKKIKKENNKIELRTSIRGMNNKNLQSKEGWSLY
jgi:hypothetical protein